MSAIVSSVAPGVFRVRDVCNVYVVVADDGTGTAFAIDFGSGIVLDHLAEMGVHRLTDVVMTHHHRDQGQGLSRAAAAGIRIHVPPVERDLFADVDEFWRTRPLAKDYTLRQDRFSLLEPVPVHDVVPEYRTATYGGTQVEVLATPGHSTGSVSYLVRRAGQVLAFTGDLIFAPGRVWSLAATQWSYSGTDGAAMTVLSCYQLMERAPTALLPSHGEVMADPRTALTLLVERMQRYVDLRRAKPWNLEKHWRKPYRHITPHFLQNRSSNALSYVLLSRSGAALVFDFGYDMTTGMTAGVDRASRRPWLASLVALRRRHRVTTIDAVLPTHYHDDHVAGINLLRDVEGTQVWAPENLVDVLERPSAHDLPCLWYDPIPVDRVLPLDEPFTWQEYEIGVHGLSGHTVFAAGYSFAVDGITVLVAGDQHDGCGIPGRRRELLNFQYRNRVRMEGFREGAALYRKIDPDVIVSGHWRPRWVDDAYLDLLESSAEEMIEAHRALLPADEYDLGPDGVLARIEPYTSTAPVGGEARWEVTVTNPYPVAQDAALHLVVPTGWPAAPVPVTLRLTAHASCTVPIRCVVGSTLAMRCRVAVDVTIGDLRLGQHAEALVDVVGGGGAT